MSEEKKNTTGGSLFSKLYNASEGLLKTLKEPFTEKALRRKFDSAGDDAVKQKIEALEELHKLRESISTKAESYDPNKVVEIRAKIEKAEKTFKHLSDEHEVLFGVPLESVEFPDVQV